MADKKVKTKRIKINEAQKTMFLGVFVAAMVVGATIVLSIYLLKYIGFNAKVISAKDEAIASYSKAINDSGTCKKPKDKNGIYTIDELKKCSPNNIEADEVVGSLRYKILVEMAGNTDLESVARDSLSVCKNSDTGEQYTYTKLNELYEGAGNDQERNYYLGMIKLCSALRVIPDALPTVRNEEALMASLNKIFILSDWNPEAISPSGTAGKTGMAGFYAMPVSLSVDGDSEVTLRVLNNIEKSIREFSISSARIEWSGELNGSAQLTLTARGQAYYTDPVEYEDLTETVRAVEKKGTKK